jgi:hypothetical protein
MSRRHIVSMYRFDTSTTYSLPRQGASRLKTSGPPGLRTTEGAADLNIHATTAAGDISARSL